MKLRGLIVYWCLLLMLGCSAETPRVVHAQRTRLYIVFIDLTRSLNAAQEQAMTRFLEQLSAGMPAGSRIVVFPLGGYVAQAGALVEAQLPSGHFVRQQKQLAGVRKALPQQILAAAQTFRERVTNQQFLRSTCISDAFRHASQLARQASDQAVEIVFISDMLEHCNSSIVGGDLSLEKRTITDEIARAKRLQPGESLPDLHGASVTALIPALGPDAEIVAGPELHVLRDFWSAALRHCNHQQENYWLHTTFPDRLTPKAGEQQDAERGSE
jgi:hypothetical protein